MIYICKISLTTAQQISTNNNYCFK